MSEHWDDYEEIKIAERDAITRWLCGACLAVGGVFHLLSLVWPGLSIPEPPIEHLIFFAVNFVLAYGFTFGFWRNSLMTLLIVPLSHQQWLEHLPLLLKSVDTKLDFQSLFTLLFMTTMVSRQLYFQLKGRDIVD